MTTRSPRERSAVARERPLRKVPRDPTQRPGRSARRPVDLPPSWRLGALEHAADAIIVAGLDGSIRYVNAAFERDIGLARDDVLGRDVGCLRGPGQPAAPIRNLRRAIRRGQTWTGELSGQRADGTVSRADASVAPVRDAAGAAVASIAILRDVSGRLALEGRLAEDRRERAALAATLAALRPGETAEDTASAIGLALLGLSGFGSVGLFGFEPGGSVVPLAALDADGRPVTLGGPLPAERSAYLRERAGQGPWIEDWQPGPDHPYRKAATEHGVRVLAYAPIRSEHDVLGVLIAGAGSGGARDLSERLPALVECAAFAGALLGPQLRSRSADTLSETRIRAIIAEQRFRPVFQPIVDLAQRTIVGYEALTRFSDGSRPDEVFAAAARCGLAIELEAATLEAALAASGPLPAAAWLNLNVSPEFVLAHEPLASILAQWGWQIVLELTEHIVVTDYVALRAALERLGPNVRLAVDDAGAGFASLRHILELRPDYVKLERGIVRRVHRDPARQALVAGLVHFAGRTGAVLVAEGVETEAEARQLGRLGVTLGQGYRLGRPVFATGVASAPTGLARPPVSARAGARVADDDLARAVNVGPTLGAALRRAGIGNLTELRRLGSVAAWERLGRIQPSLATGATLLRLEGATRGIRVTQLPTAERARLRLLAKGDREGAQPASSTRRTPPTA